MSPMSGQAMLAVWLALTAPDHSHHHAPAPKPSSKYQPTTPAAVSLVREDLEDLDGPGLVARITAAEKPVAGVTVAFTVPRLFGQLVVGEADTDDTGRAFVPFPAELPGEPGTGSLEITAVVVRSHVYFGEVSARFDGGTKLAAMPDPFPRAIWSPKADWYLLATIPVLISIVWSVYVFALSQLVRIFRTRHRPLEGQRPTS